MSISTLDIIVFVLYCFTILFIGLYVSREKDGKDKSAEDYFLAGKSLPWWAIGASLIAANISAEQFVAMNGSGFAAGLAIASYEWMAAITLLIVGKYFLPIFIEKGLYTIPEFIEKRFSTNLKTILVRIPKTASTSINRHLYVCDCQQRDFGKKPRPPRVCASSIQTYKHSTITETRAVCPAELYEVSHKVAFVRNPWDRWVSYYAHFLRYEVLNGDFGQFTENPYQTISDLNIRQMYDTFLRTSEGLSLLHCSQKQFLKNEQGEVEVDFICRFENLQQDYSLVCKRIGADPSGLGHDMKTQRSNYRSF